MVRAEIVLNRFRNHLRIIFEAVRMKVLLIEL